MSIGGVLFIVGVAIVLLADGWENLGWALMAAAVVIAICGSGV